MFTRRLYVIQCLMAFTISWSFPIASTITHHVWGLPIAIFTLDSIFCFYCRKSALSDLTMQCIRLIDYRCCMARLKTKRELYSAAAVDVFLSQPLTIAWPRQGTWLTRPAPQPQRERIPYTGFLIDRWSYIALAHCPKVPQLCASSIKPFSHSNWSRITQ